MAFINQPSKVVYVAADGQDEFDFGFKFFENEDIYVFLTPVGQTPDDETDVLDPNQYNVTPVGANIGGSITLSVAATAGDIIVILRILPITRLYEYVSRGDFYAQVVNEDQDYQTYLLQDLDNLKDLYIRLPIAGGGSEITLPAPLAAAYLRWNDAGTDLINDTEPPAWRDETLTFRNEAEGFKDQAAASAGSAAGSAGTATSEANRSKDEADRAEGIADGLTPAANIEIARIVAEGDTQEARVIVVGDTQEARVIAAGDIAVLAKDQSWEWSSAPVDQPVDDGVNPVGFSAYHWSQMAGAAAIGLTYKGTWDPTSGSYPDGLPNEPGDLYVVNVEGNFDGIDWFVGDWLIRNVDNLAWDRFPNVVNWNAILDVPQNVQNAITDTELQAGLDTKPTGSWSFDGSILDITIP